MVVSEKSIPAYVISVLETNERRRRHIENEFKRKKVKFQFFDAVTPPLNQGLLKNYCLDSKTSCLSQIEVSCFLSHYLIWQEIVNKNIPYLGVFEDDVILGEDIATFFETSKWINPDAHVIKLEKGIQKKIKTSLFGNRALKNRKLYRLHSAHFGTAGYIISNIGARLLIEMTKDLAELKPVDVLMFRVFLETESYKVLQLAPALCIQEFIINENNSELGSMINIDREARLAMNKPSLKKNKLARELKRLFSQFYDLIFKRKIKFK